MIRAQLIGSSLRELADPGRYARIDISQALGQFTTFAVGDCGGNASVRKGVRHSASAPRAWQRMLSGRRLDLLDPSPMDIEIEDIAHGLARVARWNGQTVGEHA